MSRSALPTKPSPSRSPANPGAGSSPNGVTSSRVSPMRNSSNVPAPHQFASCRYAPEEIVLESRFPVAVPTQLSSSSCSVTMPSAVQISKPASGIIQSVLRSRLADVAVLCDHQIRVAVLEQRDVGVEVIRPLAHPRFHASAVHLGDDAQLFSGAAELVAAVDKLRCSRGIDIALFRESPKITRPYRGTGGHIDIRRARCQSGVGRVFGE